MNEDQTEKKVPTKAPLWALLVGGWLGAWIGFGPAPMDGPGWWVAIVALLVLVRLPLVWVVGVAVVTKLLALVTTSVTFAIGQTMLDGPLAGPVSAVANAPFGALLGLERYLVTGGLVVGFVLGTVAALVARGRWRHRTKRVPVRPTGVLVVLLLGAGLWFSRSSFAEGLLTEETESALGQLNGATADVTGVELDLVEAQLKVENISLANRNDLSTNLFEGLELTANLSTRDLLRKRVHIEQVVVRRAESGSPRAVPGVLIGDKPVEEPPAQGGYEEYLKDFKVWRERIESAYAWIESMNEAEVQPDELPFSQRVAPHIIEPAPSMLISEILVEGLTLAYVSKETFSLSARNVSTNPALVDAPMDFQLNTNSDFLALGFTMPSAGDAGNLKFELRGLDVNQITSMLRLKPGDVLQGGTLDLSLNGPWAQGVAGFIDLPMEVTLHNTKLAIGGSQPFDVSKLVLPVHLNGRIDQPRVGFDNDLLIDALKEAGQAELVKQVEQRKQELLDQGRAKLESELGGLLGKDVDLGDELSVDGLKEFANEELETLKGDLKKDLRDTLQKELEELQGKEQVDGLEEQAANKKQELEDKAKDKLEDNKKKALDKLFGGGPK